MIHFAYALEYYVFLNTDLPTEPALTCRVHIRCVTIILPLLVV